MSDGETFDPGAAAWSLQLPQFEGPLDLLLHLCQKHELNILDIPISFVTEKYLEYLAVMQLMQLDVAAEYLVMAATLAHIKSKMLLPAPPPGQEDEVDPEDEIDPREALIRRLLEYQKYKHAGEQLAARGVAGRDIFLRGARSKRRRRRGCLRWPRCRSSRWSRPSSACSTAARSSCPTTSSPTGSAERPHRRAGRRARGRGGAWRSRRCSTELATKFDLVITFLALLEMAKLRMTRLVPVRAPGAPVCGARRRRRRRTGRRTA